MGLLDFGGKVLLEYKADTSDAKAKIKELSGEQKKAAEAELKAIEQTNKGYEDRIKKLASFAVSVAATGAVLKLAFEGLEIAGKKADLSASLAGISIDKLKIATRGMATEMELMTQAAGYNQGQFKLNQEQMEDVTAAAVALGERGLGSAAEASEALTAALVTGRTRGLERFGIAVYEGGNALETHNAILQKASELHKELATSTLDAADKAGIAKNKWSDSMSNMKESLATFASGMTPVIEAASNMVEWLNKIGAVGPVAVGALALALTKNPTIAAIALAFEAADSVGGSGKDLWEANKKMSSANWAKNWTSQFGKPATPATAKGGGLDFDLSSVSVKSLPDLEKAKAKAKEWAEFLKKLSDEQAKKLTDDLVERLQGEVGSYTDVNTVSLGNYDDTRGILDAANGPGGAVQRNQQHFEDMISQRRNKAHLSYLEQVIGPVDQFDVYASAFGMLSGAISTSMTAWIDGTTGAGEAIKKFIASSLKSLALEAGINSLKQLALAATYASTPGMQFWVPGALKSAALWGGVAIAAGAGAAALAGGGSSGGAGAGGAGGARPSAPQTPSAGGADSGRQMIIVYSDAFAEDSARKRQLQAKRMVAAALGGSGAVDE